MATAVEHGEIVLAGILPTNKENLDIALRRLEPTHFEDTKQSHLFTLLEKYSDKVNDVVPRKYLDDLLQKNIEASQHVLYMEMYDAFADMEVSPSEFSWSVEQLREIASAKATGEALAEGMEILKKGIELSPGNVLKGHEDARARLVESISIIDRELHQADSPEGLIQDERNAILEEYAESKYKREHGEVPGVAFGIKNVDDVTGGLQKGELCIVAASTSNGKSTMVSQTAWHAATQQGKNVVFFATETGRAQIRRKLVARHSKLEMFGLKDGLNTRSIKEGTLTEKEEEVFRAVVDDLTNNSAYGKIHLAQVPRGSTILSLETKLNRLARSFDVDLAVMDYLALLDSTQRVSEDRNKYVNTLREAKMVSTTVAEGAGVAFLSPWQINRAGREKADTTGYYDLSHLSDTSEAEKIVDILLTLYRPADQSGRFAEVNFQVLKNRDGEKSNDLVADADYATGTFTAKDMLSVPRAVTEDSFGSGLGDLYPD